MATASRVVRPATPDENAEFQAGERAGRLAISMGIDPDDLMEVAAALGWDSGRVSHEYAMGLMTTASENGAR